MITDHFNGLKLVVNPYIPRFQLVQFRFPKTKKARIKKKWKKDQRNFRNESCQTIYVIGGHTLIIHPTEYESLKKYIEEKNNEMEIILPNTITKYFK